MNENPENTMLGSTPPVDTSTEVNASQLTVEEELIVASAQPEPSLQEELRHRPEPEEAVQETAAPASDEPFEESPKPTKAELKAQKKAQKAEMDAKLKKKAGKKKPAPQEPAEPVAASDNTEAAKAPKKEKKRREKAPKEPSQARFSKIPDLVTASTPLSVYIRLAVAIVAVIVVRVVDITDTVIPYVDIAAAILAGYDIVISAAKDIMSRVYLSESLPLIIAAVCAFAIGLTLEGVVAVLIMQCSLIARDLIVKNTKFTALSSISPPAPEKGVAVGDVLSAGSGFRVPVDCAVAEGRAMVDCSFVTGDLAPVQFKSGDFIPAGCLCLSGQMTLRVEALPEAGISDKISRGLGSGYKQLSPTEEKLNTYARFVTPIMLFISIVLLIILPFTYDYSFDEALRRVITIIAVSSPAAALLSVPMTYLTGLVAARRSGIVFRDSAVMDKAADIQTVVFDKVGTVTNDCYVVADLYSSRMEPGVFLKIAAHAAAVSSSSVCRAIVAAYGETINFELVRDFIEYRGKGISVLVEGIQILLGTAAFIAENNIELPPETFDGTTLYMTVQGIYAGRIVLRDSVNVSIPETLTALKSNGVDRVAMISSDSRERDSKVARESGINEYYAECTAEDKVRRIKDIRSRTPEDAGLAYVGCSEYCEPAHKVSELGVILRGMEARFSCAEADIVIMGRTVLSVPEAISRASRTRSLATAKFFACMAIKVVIIILAISGVLPLWLGLGLDNAVALALIPDYTVYLRPKTPFAENR